MHIYTNNKRGNFKQMIRYALGSKGARWNAEKFVKEPTQHANNCWNKSAPFLPLPPKLHYQAINIHTHTDRRADAATHTPNARWQSAHVRTHRPRQTNTTIQTCHQHTCTGRSISLMTTVNRPKLTCTTYCTSILIIINMHVKNFK